MKERNAQRIRQMNEIIKQEQGVKEEAKEKEPEPKKDDKEQE